MMKGSKKAWTLETITDDHKALYYIISRFSSPSREAQKVDIWLKELPLRVFVFEGIVDKIFVHYDYSPASVELPDGRRYLNISQEAEDDIADLRELGVISCLKLSTTTYITVNAYRVNQHEPPFAIPEGTKAAIDKLVRCPSCGTLLDTDLVPDPDDEENLILIHCKKEGCDFKRYSAITKIEDVSYETSPYLPDIPFYKGQDEHEWREE
ncbi:MAG: hypothetical protein JW839_01780 [Candidatus Lokiarchaeota archaeon]|nr:hypothetical protein [Candidatus Lokiarchaeota archaeon]